MDYRPDRRGIGNYLQYSPELKRELMRRAALGLAVAQGLAPRRTGQLAASGRIVDNGSNGGVNHDRMEVAVEFTVPYAVPVTYPQHPRKPSANDYLEAAIPIMERG